MRAALMLALLLVACGGSEAAQSWDATAASGWIEPIDAACAPSALGRAVLEAAASAEQRRNTVPAEAMLSLANRAVAPLVTGPRIFPVMADLIAGAEAEVDIAMFVFAPSDPYEEVMGGLKRLEERRRAEGAGEPVIVRIVVDAQKALFNTGGTVLRRVTDGLARLALDPRHVQVLVATYEHLTLGNLHTKMVIVDGTTVMLGGANIQDQHDYADPWMDSFYVLQGAAAGSFLLDFDDAWNDADRWHCDASGCRRWDDAPPAWHSAAVLEPELALAPGACVPTIALTRTAWGGFNNDIDNPQDQGLLAAFDGARRRIRIQTPNLNDDAVKDAVLRAIARGVEVQLLLSLGFNDTAMNFFGGTNEETADWLAERAVNAELLQIRWYSRDGVTPVDGNVPGASHVKYMSVDGQLVVVGSTNMDTIAWNHSRETNAAVDSAHVTAAWDAAVFEPNWARAIAR